LQSKRAGIATGAAGTSRTADATGATGADIYRQGATDDAIDQD
jgi:hypothetical protein